MVTVHFSPDQVALSPGQGHCVSVLGKDTFTVPLTTQEYWQT